MDFFNILSVRPLLLSGEEALEYREEVAVGGRRVHPPLDRPQYPLREGYVFRVVREATELEEHRCRGRVARGHVVVIEVPFAHKELLLVAPDIVKKLLRLVVEELDSLVDYPPALLEPFVLAGALVDGHEPRRKERVILEHPLHLARAVEEVPRDAPVPVPERSKEKPRGALRLVPEVLSPERAPGPR